MTRRIAVVMLAALVFVATLAAPRRAAATDNLVYIIPAAIGGAVALVAIIAILVVDRSEPEYELVPNAPRRAQRGLQFAPSCALTDHGLPLACW
ncbi:hypothetical protein KF840_06380 [bacterium]|nr:hypothetical protein [bacterium]